MGDAPWLFWHRRDLRLADNLGLAQLAAHTTAITGLVVLEPGLWQGPRRTLPMVLLFKGNADRDAPA